MLQNSADGAEKAFAVKEKAQLFHIFPVEPGFYVNGQLVPPVDLRPARQAGTHVVGAVFVPLRDQVNHILAVRTAEKAKTDGVGQFLFMSSESVYGLTAPIGKTVVITKDTPLHPADNYGVSKARAEADLQALADDSFKVAILRPPMIYGKGCKGNYVTMAKLAKKLPVFPYVSNQRSMLYIENLTEFVRLLIDDEAAGIFCPQNNEYTNTSDMVNWIAHANGKGILMVRGFTWALKLLRFFSPAVDKAFGSLCYDFALSRYSRDYCVKTLEQSILETERT